MLLRIEGRGLTSEQQRQLELEQLEESLELLLTNTSRIEIGSNDNDDDNQDEQDDQENEDDMINTNEFIVTTTTTTIDNNTDLKQSVRTCCSNIFHYSWRTAFLLMLIASMLRIGVTAPIKRSEEKVRKPSLAVIDGYVSYPIENITNFGELSRNAFFRLRETSNDVRIPAYHIDGEDSDEEGEPAVETTTIYQQQQQHEQQQQQENQQHVEHMTRHHRKKNRRPGKKKKTKTDEDGDVILEGRKHALLQLADPEGLRMTQKCDGQKFKQRVRVDGCLTKVVVNRLCHGTCASYFIPRMHSKKLKAAFKSCATCAPSEYDYVDITLDCPGMNPPTMTKTIVKVKSCKCREVSIGPLYS